MDTIQKSMLIAHTLIALGIIALVLLQRGKGADAGAGFGAGASGTVFGARGSGSFFSRATGILAAAFFVTSLTLAYLSSQHSGGPSSLLEEAAVLEEQLEETPVINEEMPVSDMPSLELADDEPAIPALEDEAPAEDPAQ